MLWKNNNDHQQYKHKFKLSNSKVVFLRFFRFALLCCLNHVNNIAKIKKHPHPQTYSRPLQEVHVCLHLIIKTVYPFCNSISNTSFIRSRFCCSCFSLSIVISVNYYSIKFVWIYFIKEIFEILRVSREIHFKSEFKFSTICCVKFSYHFDELWITILYCESHLFLLYFNNTDMGFIPSPINFAL